MLSSIASLRVELIKDTLMVVVSIRIYRVLDIDTVLTRSVSSSMV